MSIRVETYGVTANGEEVKQYLLENEKGMKAVVLNYGAILAELHVPDRDGVLRDVVWGYENLEGYETKHTYFGATVGRNANRIAGGKLTIGGVDYQLEKNNGENNLHGGFAGYEHRMWKGTLLDHNKVEFSLESPDGDQGFPGNAWIRVSYLLTDENELRITYDGKADADTIFNLTNHSYFNMEGQESESVLEQLVFLDADAFTPTDAGLIPTGEIRSVEGTPMDFREFHAIGERIEADYEPLKLAGGYDHNFVLKNGGRYALCAKMKSEKSGICMEVYTDLPGIQLYTAQGLQEPGGKQGKIYGNCSAACFESQYFPDAVHHKAFLSPLVKAGETYRTSTGYKFTIC